MKRSVLPMLLAIVFLGLMSSPAAAHCEIPCGIYDDAMRIRMLYEHIATIEKSMNQIVELEKADHGHANQLVRWIMNKEQHADGVQEIASQYFMTQRIRPDMKNYAQQLALLHQMLIYAMKCKQTTDLDNAVKLRGFVKDFNELYFEKQAGQ